MTDQGEGGFSFLQPRFGMQVIVLGVNVLANTPKSEKEGVVGWLEGSPMAYARNAGEGK